MVFNCLNVNLYFSCASLGLDNDQDQMVNKSLSKEEHHWGEPEGPLCPRPLAPATGFLLRCRVASSNLLLQEKFF